MDEEDVLQFLSQRFQTRDELVQAAKSFYSSKGYVLSIKDSRKNKYVLLCCDRGGNHRDRRKIPVENRKKVSSTRLINCSFQIRGKRLIECENWVLELKNNFHNHDPSTDISGHPSSRRLTKEEILDVEKMSLAGIQPRQIISSLRQKNPNLQTIGRTIHNLKARIQRDSLGGRSLVQALFEEFSQEGFTSDCLKDENNHLTHVFFVHPKSIILTKTYSTVFVMDCTYKTNKYGMPLLDIIGMSSFNKSFYVGFAFLKNEKEEDYIWALQLFSNILGHDLQPLVIVSDRDLALKNAIQAVFPKVTHLLYVWHIQKNIVAKCKGYFEGNEDWDVFSSMWNATIYAETEEEFEETWLLSQVLYKDHKKNVITYIQNTWMPEKKKFISAWTEKYLHFENRASSRAEGAHAKLKRYLQVSTGNLREVKNKICLAIENEFQEINTQLESERLRHLHRYNVSYFKDLIAHVSIFALKQLYKQYEMVKYGTLKPVCIGSFVATMGLPCAHMMGGWNEAILPLSLIHSQWRIDTKTFGSVSGENETHCDENEIKNLLDKLYEFYHQCPDFQQIKLKKKLCQILDKPGPLIHEPTIQSRKRRKEKAKKKKGCGASLTRRDPSEFEIVEAA